MNCHYVIEKYTLVEIKANNQAVIFSKRIKEDGWSISNINMKHYSKSFIKIGEIQVAITWRVVIENVYTDKDPLY